MAGRPSKPVDMILLEGKKHITKAEIETRRNAENAITISGTIKEAKETRADKIAHKEFKRLNQMYSQMKIVNPLDAGILNRYCLAVADHARLREIAAKLDQKLDDLEALSDDFTAKNLVDLYRSINSVIGKIQTQEKQLLQYEDRLFLTPAGRLRAIPKKPEKKQATGFAAYKEKWGGDA